MQDNPKSEELNKYLSTLYVYCIYYELLRSSEGKNQQLTIIRNIALESKWSYVDFLMEKDTASLRNLLDHNKQKQKNQNSDSPDQSTANNFFEDMPEISDDKQAEIFKKLLIRHCSDWKTSKQIPNTIAGNDGELKKFLENFKLCSKKGIFVKEDEAPKLELDLPKFFSAYIRESKDDKPYKNQYETTRPLFYENKTETKFFRCMNYKDEVAYAIKKVGSEDKHDLETLFNLFRNLYKAELKKDIPLSDMVQFCSIIYGVQLPNFVTQKKIDFHIHTVLTIINSYQSLHHDQKASTYFAFLFAITCKSLTATNACTIAFAALKDFSFAINVTR